MSWLERFRNLGSHSPRLPQTSQLLPSGQVSRETSGYGQLKRSGCGVQARGRRLSDYRGIPEISWVPAGKRHGHHFLRDTRFKFAEREKAFTQTVVKVSVRVVQASTPVARVSIPMVQASTSLARISVPRVQIIAHVVQASTLVARLGVPVARVIAHVVQASTLMARIGVPRVQVIAHVVQTNTLVARLGVPVARVIAHVVQANTLVARIGVQVVLVIAHVVQAITPVAGISVPVVQVIVAIIVPVDPEVSFHAVARSLATIHQGGPLVGRGHAVSRNSSFPDRNAFAEHGIAVSGIPACNKRTRKYIHKHPRKCTLKHTHKHRARSRAFRDIGTSCEQAFD